MGSLGIGGKISQEVAAELKLVRSGLLGAGPKTPAGTEAADHAGVFSTPVIPGG